MSYRLAVNCQQQHPPVQHLSPPPLRQQPKNARWRVFLGPQAAGGHHGCAPPGTKILGELL
jgi:hypothetical protein